MRIIYNLVGMASTGAAVSAAMLATRNADFTTPCAVVAALALLAGLICAAASGERAS